MSHGHEERELLREAMTMALYLSLSLLAVLVALPSEPSGAEAAVTLTITAVGLVLAHRVAFQLSSRLVDRGVLTPQSLRIVGAQLSGALPVTLAAAVPPLFLGGTGGLLLSEILLVGFVAVVGYLAVRQSASRSRSLAYVGLIVLVVATVVTVKNLVGH